MAYRRLSPADYRLVPWKNGGGFTTDIAVSGPEPYAWRASRATVAKPGPFSDFSGYDRILLLVKGSGCRLQFTERLVELSTQLDRVDFRGEDSVDCALIDGACEDFNWVVRRDDFEALVQVLTPGTAGEGTVHYAIGPAQVRVDGEIIELSIEESVVSEQSVVLAVVAGGPVLACLAKPRARLPG
jgi:environmental stress-induced protein Ves